MPDFSKKSCYWSGTQYCIEAFEGQQNAASAKRWTVTGQLEQCPKTGRSHYQFCVKTPYGPRWSEVRKMFPGAHIEPARKPEALQQYVEKEETRIGALPKVSNLYPTQDQYWALVYDTLINGDTDKNYRVVPSSRSRWYRETMSKDNILAALDYATAELIDDGYRVETLAVNPQVRSAFAKFSLNLFNRAYADKQTDRQSKSLSRVQGITNATVLDEDHSEDELQEDSSQLSEERSDGDTGSGGDGTDGTSEGGSEEDYRS